MPISLTSPESQPPLTEARLISFTVNVELKYAEAVFAAGYLGPGSVFIPVRKVQRVWSNDPGIGQATFLSLVQRAASARDLKGELEAIAVEDGVFAGTVA